MSKIRFSRQLNLFVRLLIQQFGVMRLQSGFTPRGQQCVYGRKSPTYAHRQGEHTVPTQWQTTAVQRLSSNVDSEADGAIATPRTPPRDRELDALSTHRNPRSFPAPSEAQRTLVFFRSCATWYSSIARRIKLLSEQKE